MRSLIVATVCVSLSSFVACGGKQVKGPEQPQERDLDQELAEEEAASDKTDASAKSEKPPAKTAKKEPPRAKLVRFDLERGMSRNGAGFRVLAHEAPEGGRVVAVEFDGTLAIGEDRYEGNKFGGVALASYKADGSLAWSKRLDDTNKDYHYVAALEVLEGGDILVGGAFGERGMILVRMSSEGEERWTWQPSKEPKWAEVSSMAVDKDGDVVLVGVFQGLMRVPGVKKPARAKFFDGFVAKLGGESGELRWFQQLASAEAKASAVYPTESGDIVVAGDYRKFLRAGKKRLTGKSAFFLGRFSADGKVQSLGKVDTDLDGDVVRVQPLDGERLALHLRGENKSGLVVVSESDGAVQWSVMMEGEQGGELVADARARPDALLYVVHDTDPRLGSGRIMVREIKGDGEDDSKTVRVVDAGPHVFLGRATARRTAAGEFLIGGSMRDASWDNDGFYPFVVELMADAQRVNLGEVPSVGKGSGSRCQGTMAKDAVWRDLRVAVQQRGRQLRKCVDDPNAFGARFELESDGTVKSVEIEGEADDEASACMTEVLQKVRVCPFEDGPYERRLGQLR